LIRPPAAARVGPVVAGLLALALYFWTAAPSIVWRDGGGDSGDLATAIATGGVPHPPGYPLYVLLGRTLAAMTGIESARAGTIVAALAVSVSATLLVIASRAAAAHNRSDPGSTHAWPATAVALAIALGPLWWGRANHTTAHSLHLLFVALALAVACGGVRATAVMRGLILGLAASHHPTLLMIGALLLCPSARFAVGFALGLFPITILPLQASVPWGWGDLTTVAGVFDHLTGRMYHGYLLAYGDAPLLDRLIRTLRTLLLDGIGLPLLALLVVTGPSAGWLRSPLRLRVGLTAAAPPLLFLAYPARDTDAYLAPTVACLALLALPGASRLLGPGRGAFVRRTIVAASLLAWAAHSAVTNDRHADREALDFAAATLAAAPPRAVLLTETDATTFALWYVQAEFGVRPDVVVVDRSLWAFGWYRARTAPAIPMPAAGASAIDDAGDIGAASGRPTLAVSSDRAIPSR